MDENTQVVLTQSDSIANLGPIPLCNEFSAQDTSTGPGYYKHTFGVSEWQTSKYPVNRRPAGALRVTRSEAIGAGRKNELKRTNAGVRDGIAYELTNALIC
jgi:hypothetical protein